jgi:hypothetical protein
MGDYYGNASHQSPKQPQGGGGLDQGQSMVGRQHRTYTTYIINSFFLLTYVFLSIVQEKSLSVAYHGKRPKKV